MDSKSSVSRNIVWKIHNFTKERAIDGKSVSTNNFKIIFDNKVTKWYLKAAINDSKLAVHLYMLESFADNLTIKCCVSYRNNSNDTKYKYQFVKSSDDYKICRGYGWPRLISINEIFNDSNQTVHNGSIKLGFKIHLTADLKEVNKASTSDPRYLAVFEDFFESKSFSDLTLICSDGTEIPAHRIVLVAFSPELKKLLINDSKYNINIEDIDGPTMTEILRYIYTEKVNDIEKYAPKLLHGADKYGLNDLKDLCAKAMMKNLSIENAVDYFLLADKYKIKDLLDHCMQFIKLNHQVLESNKENWGKLNNTQLTSLLDYYQQSPACSLLFESSF